MTTPAVVLGTGPSLTQSAPLVRELDALIFGVNNTYQDFDLDVWIACDPKWHEYYGQVVGDFDKWHWDGAICARFGYQYIEGVWLVDGVAYPRSEYVTPPGAAGGLWLQDKTRISLNHCSGAQALNLAVHYGCDPILLVGHDFRYEPGRPRHYFNLSDVPGEYPAALRKFSPFEKSRGADDLMRVYKKIADQEGRPAIINCTPGSALTWFPMGSIEEYV